MQVQLNTDKNITGTAKLDAYVTEKVNHALKHYVNKVTRIEIHLSDQNADKGGVDDIQCKIEARVEGLKPVLVVSKSGSQETALDDAIGKMKASLRTIIGKMKEK